MVAADVQMASSCHLFDAGCGFPSPGLNVFEFKPIFSIGAFDFTKPMLLALISMLIVIVFFWSAFSRPKLVPRGVQNVGELGYLFVRDQISRETIGKKGDHFVPFLVSIFFFVWIMNVMSIIPFAQFPVTSRIAFPASIAGMVWFTYLYLGIKNQGFVGYFKNMMFPPGLPKWIYFLLAPIEFVSNIIVRPFTLAVRLFANMFAGHMLIVTFSVAAWYLLGFHIGALYSATSFVVVVIMVAFELMIQALQAYIITLLTASYISSSLEAEH
ncbi:F0F1 ATP synthase subunit A [Yinghuangia sp. ASG 101]|uniref:F0F1 ATP synthase subunit A n=1 Tax=Yinghuangia sp. ASG 101 TaxID=2896848 RepID=UPI001E61DE11|nr:F0F1 ATP synthase subunit A [Yinghuangia sp. ASG 101]UGQ14262.1 F0F1 ATP synthase subunit A [Yinghuangia sp. ASG 101]